MAKLIIDPTCRRRPKAPAHVLQRRRTQTIIDRPKLPLEIATSYVADFTGRRRLRLGLRRELVPTGSATVEDEPYAKVPNASYVARQALRARRRWLNYVIETGFRVVIETWAQRGGSPIKEHEVNSSGDGEGVVVVAWDTLKVNFEDPFLRPASGDTGDW
ncbi:hypothetical protein CNMCM8927_007217 [Aspergillus lentulus]|uniref:Uncharacterized protein n=1 Tax=Aspergillus lentulus TaxID=293939 RepID=A0AAN5YP40_ASPLE|nr:hypothetical protein CNMCM8060_004176 [Aspergillus lentulus]KAF4188403.1 hypothetical protein CNMCM7927_001609 [Aspergillus lentulus]KAF4196453.1 hypothetical protein CNMCM8694_004813 [Aspergillus lentulus]KAF4204589.1 hypothetical protein CNMCM8927_007217 [Aspergillus lentulus]